MKVLMILTVLFYSQIAIANPIYLECVISPEEPKKDTSSKEFFIDVKINENTNSVTITYKKINKSLNMKGFFNSKTIKAQDISTGHVKGKTIYEINRENLDITRTSYYGYGPNRYKGECKILKVSNNKI